MLTPRRSGWTAFVLKQLRIRWCSCSKSTSFLDAVEAEGNYTRLLWTIPEEDEEEEQEEQEEDTYHKGEHLIKPGNRPVIKASPSLGVEGRTCNCNLLMKCMQLKSTFTSRFKKSCMSAKDPNTLKAEGTNASSRLRVPSREVAPAPHRSIADEDHLRQQCEEIHELYRAILEGRLPLEKILNLRL